MSSTAFLKCIHDHTGLANLDSDMLWIRKDGFSERLTISALASLHLTVASSSGRRKNRRNTVPACRGNVLVSITPTQATVYTRKENPANNSPIRTVML